MTPDRPALTFRDETLTYAELNARADRLAQLLTELGSGPGTLVAVCMERSLELVVALYAVLKAGAAYVPIDPEDPAERIAFVLEDTQAPIVLTQDRLADRLTRAETRVVAVDRASGQLERGSPAIAPRQASLDDLAYVIYTSGSTGQPKGAMITHRAIANRIHWMQDAYGLTQADRVLQKTPFTFDVSVWELFWPLLFGAELVVAEPGGHKDATYLVETIVGCGITTVHFVPSMLQLFLEHPRVDRCTSLARVFCSGEALPRALQDRFFRHLGAELHNLYGPTEAAVDVTAWACDPGSELPFVPIGRPVANTQIHILDEDLRPLPIGSVGELHIGGVQVGLGYLNRRELTAERFLDDPFATRIGARLYKTGDLARYLPDGAIEFLGRSDFQVKIRGFRVELGEIEAALEDIPGVRQAVVVARPRSGHDLELVAYVATSSGEEAGVEAVRARLAARLPEHMLPTTVIPMQRFPLTSSGKVDRKALPAPVRVRPGLDVPYVEPRSSLERAVEQEWRQILDLDRVGIHDRFFELGGTSLQAARFVNRMQAQLEESIFVVTLFSAPSIAEYAAFLEAQYPAAVARWVGSDGPVVRPASGERPMSEDDLARFASAIPTLSAVGADESDRNPPAIFILSPPRSGTTLLRVMLAGHRDLFAASELQLLGFSTLRERSEAYAGRFAGWLDGTVRTIMELEGLGADDAKALLGAMEEQGLTTRQLFEHLQAAAQPRILVDKSPSYALDPATLRKAESDFDGARYIHLVRHPASMVESFEKHHMEQVLYLHEHPFSARRLAELVWTTSHRNIVELLDYVPRERWSRVRFEELVEDPAAQMEALLTGIGLAFDPAVLQPYEDLERKMVDGVYPESAPMGDPGFIRRGRIDPNVALAAEASGQAWQLGQPTLELAASLGYGRPTHERARHLRRDGLARQRELRRSAAARQRA